jgi:hypothetical protein
MILNYWVFGLGLGIGLRGSKKAQNRLKTVKNQFINNFKVKSKPD